MKKKTKIFTAILLAVCMIVPLAGCNLFGGRAADSSFPYDGALASGFEGTEAEYLAELDTPSTRERKLYEEAVRNGYTGTYPEFLKELNGGGDDSAAIQAALSCIVAVEADFFDSTVRGSGVIYSLNQTGAEAYIVTNYHVVYGTTALSRMVSTSISVTLYGGTGGQIPATFVGGAMSYDLAVLRVSGEAFAQALSTAPVTAASWGDSVTVGERVYAVGNPNGEGISVTSGVVSVAEEYVDVLRADGASAITLREIRTDAALNHGNSGGGLFNTAGELVGIVNARRETTDDGKTTINGFGYAIPAGFVRAVLGNLADNENSILLAKLGATLAASDSKGVYSEETAKYYIEQKVVVYGLEARGAGITSGLLVGDTILSAALEKSSGETVTVQCIAVSSLEDLLLDVREGDVLRLTVSRGGAIVTVSVIFNLTRYFSAVI